MRRGTIETIKLFAGLIGIAVLGGFLMYVVYGLVVGNHKLNIERDKYYADHCRVVEQKSAVNTVYRCGEE